MATPPRRLSNPPPPTYSPSPNQDTSAAHGTASHHLEASQASKSQDPPLGTSASTSDPLTPAENPTRSTASTANEQASASNAPASPQNPPPAAPVITQQEHADALHQAQTTIAPAAAEDLDSGNESSFDIDSIRSLSTSLASSALDFPFENGRRYHKFREGRYLFPNDEVEQDREDLKHWTFMALTGQQLVLAPIGDNPQRILDVGTGTGIWAIEAADSYPSAAVTGIDLSPIQPQWAPPNLKFLVDDCEDDWLDPPDWYDYIHSRNMVQGIRSWPLYLKRALRHIKPGGYMELQEVFHYPYQQGAPMAYADCPLAQYWKNVIDGCGELGVDFHRPKRLADEMRAAGFVNVEQRIYWLPIGGWAENKVLKSVGLGWKEVLTIGIQAIALGPFTRGLGWSPEAVEVFLAGVRKAYNDPSIQASMPLYVVYGQKPAE
ncbi:MAG: hypothetical protein M1819_006632 [Sarea resinae]|nr:MAG: hypothetical protein M1819_006632 [Sarea resinae]